MRADIRKSVETFKGWLVNRGYSQVTADIYGRHVLNGHEDPIEYLRGMTSWQSWDHARYAWKLYCQLAGRMDALPDILAVPGPRKPPRKPIRLPDVQTWRELGAAALVDHPGPRGFALWILYYSGLRIGDILTITYQEAQEACRSGQATIRQKGGGGHKRRLWRPQWFLQPALEGLLHAPPWRWLWCLLSSTPKGAFTALATAVPRPWHPHTFRHMVVVQMHAAGVSLRTIMETTGHDSLQTLGRYLDFVPDDVVEDSHNRMGELLFGQPPPAGAPRSRGGLPRSAGGAPPAPGTPRPPGEGLPPTRKPPGNRHGPGRPGR